MSNSTCYRLWFFYFVLFGGWTLGCAVRFVLWAIDSWKTEPPWSNSLYLSACAIHMVVFCFSVSFARDALQRARQSKQEETHERDHPRQTD